MSQKGHKMKNLIITEENFLKILTTHESCEYSGNFIFVRTCGESCDVTEVYDNATLWNEEYVRPSPIVKIFVNEQQRKNHIFLSERKKLLADYEDAHYTTENTDGYAKVTADFRAKIKKLAKTTGVKLRRKGARGEPYTLHAVDFKFA